MGDVIALLRWISESWGPRLRRRWKKRQQRMRRPHCPVCKKGRLRMSPIQVIVAGVPVRYRCDRCETPFSKRLP